MRPLGAWPAWRVALAALAWPAAVLLLAFGAAGLALRDARREAAEAATARAAATGVRVSYLPPQPGDVQLRVSGPGGSAALALLLLGPPALLSVLWHRARRRQSGQDLDPPT